jgi:HEXXH motif-containing protein
VITTHPLPAEVFTALASGDADPAIVRQLREVQRSKHLMLLHAIGEDTAGTGPLSPEAAAFQAGYQVLALVQKADRGTFAWLFGLPHMGGWAHDCLTRKASGTPADLGYLAAAAAAAAVRAGVPFELTVPVTEGRVLLPGLGYFHGAGPGPWIELRSDGGQLVVGALTTAPCAALVPDDGTGTDLPGEAGAFWNGTPAASAVSGEHAWRTLLETSDRILDRYMLPMSADMPAAEVARWRYCLESAWQLLVRHHEWAAGQVSAGVSAIIPLTARSDTAMESATATAAFGAIAVSWPPSPVSLAETLVHELEHLKLGGLLDMVLLVEPSADKVYAPWRLDPRPAGGLLQGIYAHLGVARFWNAQRQVETDPDDVLRAHVVFERWRSMTGAATATLLGSGCLTPDGTRFVTLLREQCQRLESAAVPAAARVIAADVAQDHWLTWQLRHVATDASEVAALTAGYRRGEALAGRPLPGTRIEADTRKVASTTRSRVLSLRYLEPGRYRELDIAEMPGLSAADCLLLTGQAEAAVRAYCGEISAAPEPRPDAWAGLALGIHQQPRNRLRPAFGARLPLIFDMHACLLDQGMPGDPRELAAWLA